MNRWLRSKSLHPRENVIGWLAGTFLRRTTILGTDQLDSLLPDFDFHILLIEKNHVGLNVVTRTRFHYLGREIFRKSSLNLISNLCRCAWTSSNASLHTVFCLRWFAWIDVNQELVSARQVSLSDHESYFNFACGGAAPLIGESWPPFKLPRSPSKRHRQSYSLLKPLHLNWKTL